MRNRCVFLVAVVCKATMLSLLPLADRCIAASPAPYGLICDFLSQPPLRAEDRLAVASSKASLSRPVVRTREPTFGWIYSDVRAGAMQSAYQIELSIDRGDSADRIVWDSGVVESVESTNIPYGGSELSPNTNYSWRVRVWGNNDFESEYSARHRFKTGSLADATQVSHHLLVAESAMPVSVNTPEDGHSVIDFGKAAFGRVSVTLRGKVGQRVTIAIGEVLTKEGFLNRNPGGSRRYYEFDVTLTSPTMPLYTPALSPGKRNARGAAIAMPEDIGVVAPFRYCEVRGLPKAIGIADARRLEVFYPFDGDAAHFECSDPILNEVWELCKYSIKATSFTGIYIDGDRERIPYEADAYINQLGHYCTDREYAMARRSHEYLMTHPTWPTEWIMHSVLMAWADYEYTGDLRSLEKCYDDLKAKTLVALAREDGLISTRTGLLTSEVQASVNFNGKRALRDIVDWPSGERDGYDLCEINTVVNAFHCESLRLMSKIAGILDKPADAQFFDERSKIVRQSIQDRLMDSHAGLFLDGEASEHISLHANMMPTAFGLLSAEQRQSVVDFIKSRGMACSVYGAQYLLDGLYLQGEAEHALNLMRSTEQRSWYNMIREGATITMEAWDNKFKPNQDWNHAWGAVPANVIPRRLMGIRPLEPGFKTVLIEPQPGSLEYANIKTPTIRGPVVVDYRCRADSSRRYDITLPGNSRGLFRLRRPALGDHRLTIDGKQAVGETQGEFVSWRIDSGKHVLIVTNNEAQEGVSP